MDEQREKEKLEKKTKWNPKQLLSTIASKGEEEKHEEEEEETLQPIEHEPQCYSNLMSTFCFIPLIINKKVHFLLGRETKSHNNSIHTKRVI